MAGSLTEKQKAFCDYYIETLNAAEAARRAGYKAKSANCFEVIGHENLRKPKIEGYIQKRKDSKDKERVAGQDEVLELLTRIARGLEKDIALTNKGEEIEVSPALRERLKAAELLGRRYALFTDKVEQTGDLNVVFPISRPPEETDDPDE